MRGFWLESVAWEIGFGVLFTVAYYLLYQQILDHAMTARRRDDKSLIGGHWLDVLAVLAVIQFGTAFSTTFYWLLLALPAWGAWSLYQTIMGKEGIMGGGGSSMGSASTSSATASGTEGAVPTNRKQRRADQRNQQR